VISSLYKSTSYKFRRTHAEVLFETKHPITLTFYKVNKIHDQMKPPGWISQVGRYLVLLTKYVHDLTDGVHIFTSYTWHIVNTI